MDITLHSQLPYHTDGLILSGVGGRYTIELDLSSIETPLSGQTVTCRAKGAFRHAGVTPLPGDRVTVGYSKASFRLGPKGFVPDPNGTDIRIERIHPRRSALIRPPMANLDILFIMFAVTSPEPALPMIDKLISVAEHNGIEPVILVGKCDLNPIRAEEMANLYRHAGFRTFEISAETSESIDLLHDYINTLSSGQIAAFAGASGVGKSTLMNRLFPSLSQETGSVSEKTERGRHTTRQVTLFSAATLCSCADLSHAYYLADTPGFSLLDFEQFDFMQRSDLFDTMREFRPYLGQCRYTDCTHTKEQDCAIVQAVRRGDIAQSRHESFLLMDAELKDKKAWEKSAKKE